MSKWQGVHRNARGRRAEHGPERERLEPHLGKRVGGPARAVHGGARGTAAARAGPRRPRRRAALARRRALRGEPVGRAGIGADTHGGLRAGLSARLWSTRYDAGERDGDPHGRSHGLHVARRVDPGTLIARGTFSRETPQRRDLRWTSREVGLGHVADIGWDWNLAVRLRGSRTRFDDEHPLFLQRRKDRTLAANVTVSHRAVTWRGCLSPGGVCGAARNS